MAKSPLFSTYRQGENRVTSSMLAVFERIDLGVVEALLAAASEEASLSMVAFANQSGDRSRTIPDAAITGSFRYLFEVKTSVNSARPDQLRGHLMAFEDLPMELRSHIDQRLFVVTPDLERPTVLDQVGDKRIVWFSFLALSQAIDTLLEDPLQPISEQGRFLLRELQALFAEDGLTSTDDAVVVAARVAYPEYLRHHAYVCQSGRAFRLGARYMGFYSTGAIQREVPLILHRRDDVLFSDEEAARLVRSSNPIDTEIATLIRDLLEESGRSEGESFQVFLLTPPDDERTIILPGPVRNTATDRHGQPLAWTQGQRYTRSDLLRSGPATTDQLVTER